MLGLVSPKKNGTDNLLENMFVLSYASLKPTVTEYVNLRGCRIDNRILQSISSLHTVMMVKKLGVLRESITDFDPIFKWLIYKNSFVLSTV